MLKRILAGLFAACLLLNGGGYIANAQAVTTTSQQTGKCVGKVIDEEGEPVVGATVKVVGTTNGTMTDIEGAFSLNGVAKGSTIAVTCVGYAPQQMIWNGRDLYFTLNEAASALDEVVVVGYGTQKKANLTGAVSTMNASAIEDRSVASISAAMAGEMPGVVVVQSSGAPGGQTGSITVRGSNSVNAASPLVIVDGVPGSMNNIDPQDVESISVLKDAASAAIYGVQAANGVILVTTKKGKLNTAPVITYSGNVAFTKVTTKLDQVNAREYTMLKREAALNIDPNADVSSFDATLAKYDSGELDPIGTNWWDETFKSHGTETSHTIQINGGSANTTYMMSVGYLYQGGMLDQTNYNRYNGRMNMESQLKPWISLGGQISFYRGVKKDGYTSFSSIVQHANRLNATNVPYLDADKTEFAAPNGFQNPIAERDNRTGDYRSTADQLFANVYTNITPVKGLSIRPLFSWRHDNTEEYGYKKILFYDGKYNNGENGTRSGYRYFYRWDWMTYQLVANYNKTFAEKHNLALLAGYESQHYIQRTSTMTRTGGGDNALTDVLNSLSETGMKNSDTSVTLNRQSWFGRVQYDYMGKYLFEANLRADASSRFPKDNRWGYFPAMSAAWRISEESFMESTRSWLNQLKIRLGWGRTGNEEISEYYPAVATYAYDNLMIGNALYNALYESKYVNNKLKWATVTNWELGVEAAFFNNRLTFEGSLYKRTTKGMLLNLPILSALGVSAPPQNAGSVENKGVDITLGYRTQLNKDWGISATFNMGYNHNEITNLSGTAGPQNGKDSDLIWYLEGHPINSYYGYVCDGIFKDEAEVKAGPLRTGNEKPGNLRFKDLDGDGRITSEDRAVIGKMAPTWMGGINIGATFRDFDLSMLWQGAFDYERYMTGEASQAFYNSGTMTKWQMRERWSPENPNGTYPRLYTNSSGSPDVVTNSYWSMDASYVRLKNLTFGYNIPTFITEKIGVNKIRVYFNGENLLTFSKLFDKGIDPEAPTGRGAYYANVRKYSLGLKVTF